MKFVTFRLPSKEIRAGWLEGDKVIDMNLASEGRIPSSMMAFLEKADEYVEVVRNVKNPNKGIYALEEVQLTAALPNPSSIRDFYAFEQHVKTARGRRGLDVVPEWYDIPVFYFTNHRAVIGSGDFVIVSEKV